MISMLVAMAHDVQLGSHRWSLTDFGSYKEVSCFWNNFIAQPRKTPALRRASVGSEGFEPPTPSV
jgi:hypothetical protein